MNQSGTPTLPMELQPLLNAQLRPGEKLVWSTQPLPRLALAGRKKRGLTD